MKKTFPVDITDLVNDHFYYPLELGDQSTVKTIHFGHLSTPAIIQQHPTSKQQILLSRNLAELLKFQETKVPLHLYSHKNNFYLGPLVGIFSSGFSPFLHKPLGERTAFFAKLLSLSEETGCIPFLFGDKHINWNKETIRGYVYKDNQWTIHDFPFPNVVYDRLPNRQVENSSGPKAVKRRFQKQYAIPWYNPGFFNKWDIHKRLSADEQAVNFLPETYSFQSFSAIETLLSKYRQVFIKPVHGSLGLGIYQVLYDKHNNVYYCRYRDKRTGNKLKRSPSLESMVQHIFKHKPLDHLIIQQGIPLIRFNNRQVDFRVHTNKNEHGEWQVTALAAKVAGEGSVTTHVHNGGKIMTLDELFQDDMDLAEGKQNLSHAALYLSSAIEKHVDGIIAEIGFDLGIDKQGRVWMFEANSKPGRSIFSHPNLHDFERLTRKLALDYAVYLAEQSISLGGLPK